MKKYRKYNCLNFFKNLNIKIKDKHIYVLTKRKGGNQKKNDNVKRRFKKKTKE